MDAADHSLLTYGDEKSMEARPIRLALLAAVLLVSMGAKVRTPNFIIETRDPALARQIGRAAEKYRRDLAVEWLGKAMPNWSQPCTMTVHAGPHLGAGGATSFVFDHGQVFGWRMTIQGSPERVLDSVLPHEITHMVLASHFRRPLPRWADEGAASSAETPAELSKHRKMLIQFLQTGRGIAFDRMFAMKQYPRDIMPLYAQGFSLAEYLIQRGGKRRFLAFVAEGMESEQWSAAIRRHYGVVDTRNLQHTWLAWVRQGSPALKSLPQQPAARPPATMVAADQRLPRPEPNLVVRSDGQVARPYAPGSVIAAKATIVAQNDPPSEAKLLPNSGWYVIGAGPARPPTSTPTTPAAQPSSPEPIRGHLSRPQPYQHPLPYGHPQPYGQPQAMSGCISSGG